jgi:hypothetical protein
MGCKDWVPIKYYFLMAKENPGMDQASAANGLVLNEFTRKYFRGSKPNPFKSIPVEPHGSSVPG